MKYSGMKYQSYVAVTAFCCTTFCASLNCERKSKEKCFEDCQWNKVDKCIECPVGYYGINCSRPCRYPNYGINCQYDCSHCGQEACSSTFGCMTTDCPDGYYGINCSRKCRYPNYGKHCQQDCSQCNREMCNSTLGCLTHGGTIDREYQNVPDDLNLPMVIGIFVGVSAVLVIATLFVIALANRRFYSRQIKLNAYYVGSVVSEHITTTIWRPTEQRSDICDANISTDNSIYMLAGSHRYENM